MGLLSIGLEGFDDLEVKLSGLGPIIDPEDIVDEMQAIFLNRIKTRFLAKVDPEGTPWIPSAAGLAREDEGLPGTLFETGTLFRSIHAYKIGDGERALGTDVPYAARHNFGIDGMATRTFLGFGAEDLLVAERLVLLRIAEALNG